MEPTALRDVPSSPTSGLRKEASNTSLLLSEGATSALEKELAISSRLSQQQLLEIAAALVDALDHQRLNEVLMRLNRNLTHFAGPADSLPSAVGKVLNAANLELWVTQLLDEALASVPADVKLKELCDRYCHSQTSTTSDSGRTLVAPSQSDSLHSVSHFPDHERLRWVADGDVHGGRLLIVEDQLLEELTGILSKEHVVLGVATWADWITLCDEQQLDSFRGAIIDRHLEPLEPGLHGDGLGLEIARYMRDHTQIRPVLLSVDVDNRHRQSENLIEEYRLQEVVRKERGGRLDVNAILEAARSVMIPTAEDQKVWIKRCLATANRLTAEFCGGGGGGGGGAAGRDFVRLCHQESEVIRELLTQGELLEAAEALQEFQRRWTMEALRDFQRRWKVLS